MIPPIPPMYYPLEAISSSEMVDKFIPTATTGCLPTKKAIDEMNMFLECVKQNPNKTWTFGYIPAPPNSDITRCVIGKNGYYFKMTTTLSEVGFIWHNRSTNNFLFWGTSIYRVVKAMNSIRWRIHKCYLKNGNAQNRHYVVNQPTYPDNQICNEIEDISDDEDIQQPQISYGCVPDTETSLIH